MRTAKSPKARRAVLMALGGEDSGAPVSVLVEILKSETDPDIKQQAVLGLGQSKSDEAVPALLEALG